MKKQSLYIITGSSKGIGKALVKILLKDPQNIIVGISRSEDKRDFNQYVSVPLDLGNLNEIKNKLDRIFPNGDFDRIALINNAGWIGEIDHLGKISPESIQSIFDINTVAPAVLMNAYVNRYGANPDIEKTVVNISSGAAHKAIDGWSGYSASKAALNMLTQTAQEEANMDGLNIQYYAVSPGVVDTEMQADIRSASEDKFSLLQRFQNLKEENALSSPEEAAKKIIYLIEHRSNFKAVLQDVRDFNI